MTDDQYKEEDPKIRKWKEIELHKDEFSLITKEELEQLCQQYQDRQDHNQCVRCGNTLDLNIAIELLTGWSCCYDCGQHYDPDEHRHILDLLFSQIVKDLGVASSNELPAEMVEKIIWTCEMW